MGRQLRKVAANWEHPKDEQGRYIPMEYTENDKHTHIQLYENTSEGTPISPVFTADETEELAEYAAEHCTIFSDTKIPKEGWLIRINSDLKK